MKTASLKLALPAIALIGAFSVSVRADDVRGPIRQHSGFEAKVQYCGYCHGASGQGYHGYYAMPRLAGQRTEYFVNQLQAFAESRRDTKFAMKMSRVHGVGQSMRVALANRFASLNPRPLDGGHGEQVALGRKIFDEGVPNANIPACAACHGPDAKGVGVNPRLAGQLHSYTVRQLANWSRDRGEDTAHPGTTSVMLAISRAMSKSQMAAVAAYVSSLK